MKIYLFLVLKSIFWVFKSMFDEFVWVQVLLFPTKIVALALFRKYKGLIKLHPLFLKFLFS